MSFLHGIILVHACEMGSTFGKSSGIQLNPSTHMNQALNYILGAKLNHTCNIGYEMGDDYFAVVQCQNSLHWTVSRSPTCRSKISYIPKRTQFDL